MTSRKKRIEQLLIKNFSEYEIIVEDTSIFHKGHGNFNGLQESHFKITLKSYLYNNKTRLEIHKKINSILDIEFNSGLHALEIKITN
tara:strand:+ start:534 stop:794 length:261 start_codon:yes stop_codon:yes gene_type:complete